jgi:hypothetical protein
MRNVKSLICLLTIFLVLGCNSDKKIEVKEISKINIFDNENKVELKIYKFENSFLYRIYKNNELNDELIINNIDLILPLKLEKRVFLSNDKSTVYFHNISIYGSTFGANTIIYLSKIDDNNWCLIKDNFTKSEVVDNDSDGFYEIKVLEGKFRNHFFKFNSGLFLPTPQRVLNKK